MSKVLDLLREAGVECYTRAEWGSRREREGWYARRAKSHPTSDGRPYHFLHITVTADTDSKLEGFEGARTVEGYGLSSGAPMVSYQLLVTNEGRVFEGQDFNTAGTHTVNDKGVPGYPHNLNYYGNAVAIMQNVQDEVTDVQVDVIAKCFAAAELAGHAQRGARIHPHRTFDWKSCPGDKAVARLGEIQRLKDKYVNEGLVEDDMASPEVQDQLDRIEKLLVKLDGRGKNEVLRDIGARERQARQHKRLLERLDQLGVNDDEIKAILAEEKP